MTIRTMPDGRTITSDGPILGYHTTSEHYATLSKHVDLTRLPYSVIEDGIEWRSDSPLRIEAAPARPVVEFVFIPLWDDINVSYPATLRGTSPIDALLRYWATFLPDTALSSPLRCIQDGHTYHTRLNEAGEREISVRAVPIQGTVSTL